MSEMGGQRRTYAAPPYRDRRADISPVLPGRKVFNWLAGYCIVTSERLIVIRGVLARDVAMIPFVRIIDINFERSRLGNVIGYGNFILEVDDQDMPMWKIDLMPYPEQLVLEVFQSFAAICLTRRIASEDCRR
jgi:Bacterial PH domain